MKIISQDKPIVYSNAFGDGTFLDKVKGLSQKVGNVGQKLGNASQKVGGAGEKIQNVSEIFRKQPPQDNTQSPPPPPAPTGMSKGLKIGLAVGGAVILGTIIYLIARKK